MIRIPFLLQSPVGYRPEEEDRQTEKLHSTLKVSRKEEGGDLMGGGRLLVVSDETID